MAGDTFSIGISPEEKLSLPLGGSPVSLCAHDALIRQKKKATPKVGKKAVAVKGKKKVVKEQRKEQRVKKTVVVHVPKAVRARVNNAASSTKRQAVMNKHRQGLVVKNTPAKGAPKIRLPATRARQTSVMRPAVVKTARSRAAAGKTKSQDGDLDVSNIKRHFRTHPKKFTLPQGSNFRITVNLNNLKPVLGSK